MGISRKILWIFLFVVGLAAMVLPGSIQAQADKIDLTMRLVSDSYYNSITAGKDKTLFLEIGNTGNKALTNIRLYADLPEGWIVKFSPGLIDYLSPGNFQTVDVIVKPAGNASKGEYAIPLIAEAKETRRVTSIYVRVESASFWVWVGAGVGALVIAGFILIFIHYGRQ